MQILVNDQQKIEGLNLLPYRFLPDFVKLNLVSVDVVSKYSRAVSFRGIFVLYT